MKNIKVQFLGALLLLCTLNIGWAQQQVMFTQYMFNAIAINPAYTGHAEAVSATALTRHQWVGIEGAPNTQTLSLHSPISRNKIALGVLFIRDKIGITTQNGIFTTYAYRIKFGKDATLSMGLQMGFTDYQARYSLSLIHI